MKEEAKAAVRAMYDEMGADGLRAWANFYQIGSELDFVRTKVKEGEVVLDLGCGYGRVAVPLSEYTDVYGLDISPKMIQAARQANSKAQFEVGDMCALPYPDSFFDKVLCLWSSFVHLIDEADQLACINEIYRVLRAGGSATVVLVDPNLQFLADKLAQVSGRVVELDLVEGHSAPIFVHNEDTLHRLMKASRFTTFSIGFESYDEKQRFVLSMTR